MQNIILSIFFFNYSKVKAIVQGLYKHRLQIGFDLREVVYQPLT